MTARFWRGGVLPVVLLVVLLQEAQGVALERVAYYRTTNTTRRSSWKYIQGSSYRIALFLAQEEAKCLEAYGTQDLLEKRDESSQRFRNFKCVKSSPKFRECEKCQHLTKFIPTEPRCAEVCELDMTCLRNCSYLLERVEELRALKNSKEIDELDIPLGSNGPIFLDPPEVFCEDMSLPPTPERQSPEFHIVVLKWRLRTNGSETTLRGKAINFPVVFVLERMDVEVEEPRWDTLGKTLSLMEPVNSPWAGRIFRYGITAVGPNGPLVRAISEPIPTHDGFKAALPPRRIYKVEEIVHDNSIDVLIAWDPPEDDKPCDYKVVQTRPDGEGKSVSHRLTATDLKNGLQVWFYDLKFRETYDIGITSRRANWVGFQSDLRSQTFTMPTCLVAQNNSFEKCVPSPPQNLSQKIIVVDFRWKDEGRGQVKLRWDPPPYTSLTNRLLSYTLLLGIPYDPKSLNNNLASHSAIGIAALSRSHRAFSIPGDETEFLIRNLTLNRRYPIALIATSIKGDSPPAYFTLDTTVGKDRRTPLANWVYLSIPLSLLIVGIFGCHFLRVFLQKRQVKHARNQYFLSMEERDGMNPDWSIVPLNDDSPVIKLMHEELKEKWELSYDNLIMGEIIGQGAFGVVRKAKICQSKMKALTDQKFPQLLESRTTDENGMETVAVKMLKVSATQRDREELIKEIITMQNLGGHPQIVRLLGACTKGRSLCLVLEFCPGGDLLSFLRKVRTKYWPTLGLSEKGRSWSDKSLKLKNFMRNSRESGCTSDINNSNTRKSSDSSVIKYADMDQVETINSHSPERLPTLPDTVINHEYGRTPSEDAESDGCRPIDEKDILSYARQIAMGMEYLEKNRIVHRDLAGRNVLLMGDYKQVKISDFGLSRDIYTWNVYHQTSNGKLPLKWMAIESIFTHVFTSKSDVWSFGILLWELVTLGGTPYPGLGNTELFNLLKSSYRMERPENCSEELYALMKKCWRTSPASRPNFTELRQYLETMLEAAEPNLYLSLMADIPPNYFHLTSKSDFLHLKLEDESQLDSSHPKFSNSGGSSYSQNTRIAHQKDLPLQSSHSNPKNNVRVLSPRDEGSSSLSNDTVAVDPIHETSPIRNLPTNWNDGMEDKLQPLLSRANESDPVKCQAQSGYNSSHPLDSQTSELLKIRKIYSRHSAESLVTPDSGYHRSDAHELGGGSSGSEERVVIPFLRQSGSNPSLHSNSMAIPLKRLNYSL